MKVRFLHIFTAFFLIGTLVFAQVAVNFFHRNHDVHQLKSITKPLKGGAPGLQKHGEHCQVCAIDFFNHVFVAHAFTLPPAASVSLPITTGAILTECTGAPATPGRAPPTVA